MVTRARCCNPLHGEEIIGYVTRGKGVPYTPNVQERNAIDGQPGTYRRGRRAGRPERLPMQ